MRTAMTSNCSGKGVFAAKSRAFCASTRLLVSEPGGVKIVGCPCPIGGKFSAPGSCIGVPIICVINFVKCESRAVPVCKP